MSGSTFTFAVIGDNRGTVGDQPAAFRALVRQIRADRPQFVWNTGDMITGYTSDHRELQRQWGKYRHVLTALGRPMFHVPGNHDVFDAASLDLYKRLWGPTYYSFERDGARFLALDTESEPGRVGTQQFRWLEHQLRSASRRPTFVFLHRPLFPVDGHVGGSLDIHPRERDRLHRLFVRHRASIKGVFLGHEHLYHFERRDGVPYYITGGGGAPLYVPPELGGFNHYLLVRLDGDRVSVSVRPLDAHLLGTPSLTGRTHAPTLPSGTLLESWEDTLFPATWDNSVFRSLLRGLASKGTGSVKMSFDFRRCESPLLYLPLRPARDASRVERMQIDIYVPPSHGALKVTPSVEAIGGQKFRAPAVPLRTGWNTITTRLGPTWLPDSARRSLTGMEWMLTPGSRTNTRTGWVAFDNLRAHGNDNIINDWSQSWEGPLLWGTWGFEGYTSTAERATEGRRGLKLWFNFANYARPTLYGDFAGPRDWRRAKEVTTDVFVPAESGSLLLSLRVLAGTQRHVAPSITLRPGWNRVRVPMHAAWLAAAGRRRITQIAWVLSPGSSGENAPGWVIFDNLRTEATSKVSRR